MKKYRFATLLSVVALALSLTACGGSVQPTESYYLSPDFTEVKSSASFGSEGVKIPAEYAVDTSYATKSFTFEEWTGKIDDTASSREDKYQSQVVALNELPHHTAHTVVYGSVEDAVFGARDYDFSRSKYYKLLTGEENKWQLAVYENVSDAEKAGVYGEFFKPEFDLSSAPVYEGDGTVGSYGKCYYGGFKEVTLPASWQTQGFDFPIYSNIFYPWNTYKNGNVELPNAPKKTNPVGFYLTEFNVDSEWLEKNRSVYISFGGVESCYYLWVNGHEVGYSEDSYDTSEFDITPYLNADGSANTLAVMVMRWCDGSYFENQDFLRLAGIFRDVYLYSAPAVQIFDYTVTTDLDDSYKNADLGVSVKLLNRTSSELSDGFEVCLQLFDADGSEVLCTRNKLDGGISAQKTAAVDFAETLAPELWSDESPYLYTLVLSLCDGSGNYYGSVSQQLGFRELSFTRAEGNGKADYYDTVLLNGNEILLKGVNRHDSNGEKGKYVPHELYEKDVEIMKQLNINALRTSHYPDDEYLYYLCDKYGILMIAECNLETHYAVNDIQTMKFFSNVLEDRVDSLFEREKNRTSVIIWSLGNESSRSPAFEERIADLKSRDSTRMVHFESYGTDSGVDVGSGMYWDINGMNNMGNAENHMPWIQCEYAHAMGNSVGHLYEYWEAVREHDNLLGAFIWDFVDQTLYTEVPEGKNDYLGTGYFYAYGGTWNDAINSGDFCQNGIVSPDRTVQPEGAEVKYVYQNVWFKTAEPDADLKAGKFAVYNEFKTLNLNNFDFEYDLLCDGKVRHSGTFEIDCKPKKQTSFYISYSLPDDADGEWYIVFRCKLKQDTLWAKAGYVIAEEKAELISSGKYLPSVITEELSFEKGEMWVASGEGFSASFDPETGALSSYIVNGEELLAAPASPAYRRAKLSNDTNDFWDKVTVGELTSLTDKLDSGDKDLRVEIEAVYSLNNANGAEQTVTYTVYGNGMISIKAVLNQGSGNPDLARYGFTLPLIADFEDIEFYGDGPADGYNDRARAGMPGIYKTTVTESLFPYGKPQDSGLKMNVRWFKLSTQGGTNLIAYCGYCGKNDAQALHYTPAQIANAKYTYSLPTDITATYLTVGISRGTGGASCGPATLEQYTISHGKQTVEFTIMPVNK